MTPTYCDNCREAPAVDRVVLPPVALHLLPEGYERKSGRGRDRVIWVCGTCSEFQVAHGWLENRPNGYSWRMSQIQFRERWLGRPDPIDVSFGPSDFPEEDEKADLEEHGEWRRFVIACVENVGSRTVRASLSPFRDPMCPLCCAEPIVFRKLWYSDAWECHDPACGFMVPAPRRKAVNEEQQSA